MYITEDTGKIFVDISDTQRIQLNAEFAEKVYNHKDREPIYQNNVIIGYKYPNDIAFWVGTQQEYEDAAPHDDSTLYYVIEEDEFIHKNAVTIDGGANIILDNKLIISSTEELANPYYQIIINDDDEDKFMASEIMYDDTSTLLEVVEGKQPMLTGKANQIVSFNQSGEAIATDPIPAATSTTVTLYPTGWQEDETQKPLYSQTVTVDGITTDPNQVIIVDVNLFSDDSTDLNGKAQILEAWRGSVDGTGPASQDCVQGENSLTFYCIIPPTNAIPLNIAIC